MPAASILPVAIHNNKLYFLFGKENPLEDSAKGFSDFGGGMEPGETALETALREGSEELTGFLGTKEMLRKRLKKTGTYCITHTFSDTKTGKPNTYTVFLFPFVYSPELPEYFNNNHSFLWKRMDTRMLSKTRLFEKISIDWFCEDDLEKREKEYRPFYRDVVKHILADKEKIRHFIQRGYSKRSFTQRNSAGLRMHSRTSKFGRIPERSLLSGIGRFSGETPNAFRKKNRGGK
jgi:hypothetical protein